jgi:type IV fimbrial biogenesis protein FimT
MLIVIAVLAIVAAIATPSLADFVTSARIQSGSGDLAADLALARNEAIRRGRRVTVCPTTDGANCLARQSAWHIGWMVFADLNANGVLDAPGDELLIRRLASANNQTITASALDTNGWIQFRALGTSTIVGDLLFCTANKTGNYGRRLTLLFSGTTVVEDQAQCA